MYYSRRYDQAKLINGNRNSAPMRTHTRWGYISHQNLDRDRTIATNITHYFNDVSAHRSTIAMKLFPRNGISLIAKDSLCGDSRSHLLINLTPLQLLCIYTNRLKPQCNHTPLLPFAAGVNNRHHQQVERQGRLWT